MKSATRFHSVSFHVTHPWAFTLLVAEPSPWKLVPEPTRPSWELLLGTQGTQDTMLPGTEDTFLPISLFSFIHIRIPARNKVTRRGKQVGNACNFPFLLRAWSQPWLLLEATSARGILVLFHSVPTDLTRSVLWTQTGEQAVLSQLRRPPAVSSRTPLGWLPLSPLLSYVLYTISKAIQLSISTISFSNIPASITSQNYETK